MADELAAQRAKLTEMFAFWGWQVGHDDVRLDWHIEAELSLAIWVVWRHTPDGLRKSWVVTEPTGMLPIDHLAADGVPTHAAALRAFGERWQKIASERLEGRIGPERTARIRRDNPAMLQQAEHMRTMIGVAGQLLLGLADEASPSKVAR